MRQKAGRAHRPHSAGKKFRLFFMHPVPTSGRFQPFCISLFRRFIRPAFDHSVLPHSGGPPSTVLYYHIQAARSICPEYRDRTSRPAPENSILVKKDYSSPPSGSGRMTEISSVYPPNVSYSCFRKFPSRSNCVRRAIFTSSTASASDPFPASFWDNSMWRK